MQFVIASLRDYPEMALSLTLATGFWCVLRQSHYASFHTGPSARTDIEDVLIHGAQGVRSLSAATVAHAAIDPTHSS
jgi:hypothetical protein